MMRLSEIFAEELNLAGLGEQARLFAALEAETAVNK